MIRLTIILIAAAFSCVLSPLAQRPDSWRGLTLEESSVGDTISLLGQPRKRKTGQKFYTVVDAWIDKDQRYEKLEYRGLKGIKKARLYFTDARLKIIEIELKVG